MLSTPLQTLMAQSHIEDLHRHAASRQRFAAKRSHAPRHGHTPPVSGHLTRAMARVRGLAAPDVTATPSQVS